jgi:hypothetical protein
MYRELIDVRCVQGGARVGVSVGAPALGRRHAAARLLQVLLLPLAFTFPRSFIIIPAIYYHIWNTNTYTIHGDTLLKLY